MRNEFLIFSSSRPSITEVIITAVGEVLRSWWITTGPKAASLIILTGATPVFADVDRDTLMDKSSWGGYTCPFHREQEYLL